MAVSSEGRVLMANRAWREALGWSETDLPDLSLFDVTDRADHATCQAWLRDPDPRRRLWLVHLRLRTRVGREFPAEGACSAEVQNGQLVLLYFALRDRTMESQHRARLREQTDLLQAVTTYAPVGVFRVDGEGRLTYANERWRRFAGMAHVLEPRGVWWQMVHPDDRPRVGALWQRARLQSREILCEYRSLAYGDRVCRFRTRLATVTGAEGTSRCWIGVTEDITAAWEANRRLEGARQDLEATVAARTRELRAINRELSEFAYAVTHDMKAPLRGIHRITEWLVKDHLGQLGPEGVRLCEMLQDRVRFLNDFVEGMLAYTRIGRERVIETDVPLGTVLAGIRDVLSPPSTVEWIVPEPAPVVRGVPEYLYQVFQNLLDNAVRHLPRQQGRVEVTCRRLDAAWEFAVADNGPGIPRRYHDKIFQIFQKLPSAAGTQGTGLGLALVKRIIDSRGGTIHLESDSGHGTTVRFVWPDQPAAGSALAERDAPGAARNGATAPLL
jgi:PAS domain S-box-containing protein